MCERRGNEVDFEAVYRENFAYVYRFLLSLCRDAHLAEELWVMFGHEPSVALEKWPEYDEAKTVDDEIEIVVQINGRVKEKLDIATGMTREEMEKTVMAEPSVQALTEGKQIVKVIAVPDKLVNIVVK